MAVEFFFVHAYTACVSVEKTLKSPFLYGLPMGKLLVISRGPKWRSNSSGTCLYSVCAREKNLKIAIFVWTAYEQVVGNQSRTEMAVEFSCTCLYSVCERGQDPKIVISVWASYVKVVGNQSRTKMVTRFFSYMPMHRMRAWRRH